MSAPREILLLCFGAMEHSTKKRKNSVGAAAKMLLTLFFHIYPTGMFMKLPLFSSHFPFPAFLKKRNIRITYGRAPTSANAYIKVLNQLLF